MIKTKNFRKMRLLQLADFLLALPAEKFNFNIVSNGCGSVGCAMGWTPVVFPHLDIITNNYEYNRRDISMPTHNTIYVQGYRNVAQNIFNITHQDVYGLFVPDCDRS